MPDMWSEMMLVVGVVALVGCDDRARELGSPGSRAVPPSSSSSPSSSESSPAKDERYQLQVEPASVSVGSTDEVTLTIRAGHGLKINREFPSWSLELDSPEGLTLARTSWERESFSLTRDRAMIHIQATAETAGRHSLRGRATFSICNAETCHILRDEPIALTVRASSSRGSTTSSASP